MPKQGISLHLGINRADSAHYGGWDGQLTACEADAKDMQALTKAQGFPTQMLLTPQGTSAAVISGIHGAMPPGVCTKTYRLNKTLYDGIQKKNPGSEKAAARSTVILISGCMDNQTSLDGTRNGLFTEKLRKVWSNGKFAGTHKQFRDRIASLMPSSQTPNYYIVGAANPGFEAQKPFTI